MKHDGGCLCGAIRFTSTADPTDAGYCHCELCRRSTGATVLAWVSYPAEGFAYVAGTPARYPSSDHGNREFCSRCGTQIAYRDTRDTASIEVNVGSLDDCEWVVPRCHIWYQSRVGWFDIADSLPRFATSRSAGIEVDVRPPARREPGARP